MDRIRLWAGAGVVSAVVLMVNAALMNAVWNSWSSLGRLVLILIEALAAIVTVAVLMWMWRKKKNQPER